MPVILSIKLKIVLWRVDSQDYYIIIIVNYNTNWEKNHLIYLKSVSGRLEFI